MKAKSQKKGKPGPLARHGGYSLLTRGTLPERRRYIAPYLTAVREGLIHDLAKSEEDLTTAQRVLVDRVTTFLGCIRLMEEHAREHGLLDAAGRLRSGIGTGHYLGFNRFVKEALALLGVERRTMESELTPAEIARIVDEEAAGQEGESGNGEIASPKRNAGDIPGEGEP